MRMNAYTKQVNESFINAMELIDAKTHLGYALEHPELVAAWIQAETLAHGLDEIAASLSHLESFEQRLLDIANSIHLAGK
jgi:hypothetical protein